MLFLREIGCLQCDVVAKSDQEPAITSIVSEVGRIRAASGGGSYIVESSPVGSSGSNGVVERAIRSVEQQVRVMKDALEHRTGMQLTPRYPLMTWITEYAGHLLNRFEVGHDGKTAYERCKGKRTKTLGIEFGEAILWKRKAVGGALAKMTCLWEDGVYLGVRGASGEIIVGDKNGVWKTRSVQRKPLSQRWAEGALEVVEHVPWRVSDNDPNVDGEKLVFEDLGRQMLEPEVTKEKEAVFVPHRIMIKKEDLEKYGYSAGCPGCKAIMRGTARQGHSEACRSRIETELRDDPRMKAQKKRQEEFLANKLENQEEKRRKMETKEAVKDEGMGTAAAAASSALPASSSSSSTSAGPAPQMQEEQDQHREEEDEEMDREKGEKREGVLWEELARRIKDAKKIRVDMVLNEALIQEDDDPRRASLHFDTKTGKELNKRAVAAARKEEIEFMRQIKLYDKVDLEECIRMTGRPPVSTKWVEVDKGTTEKPDVRCRLVARDFRVKGEGHRDDLFAAMPPLEAKKLLFKMAAATWKGRSPLEPDKIMLIDVKKAHFNGVVGADVWACIELPEEDYEGGKCGRLRRWLYGMRPAAKAWEDDYAEKLESIGFLLVKDGVPPFGVEGAYCRAR